MRIVAETHRKNDMRTGPSDTFIAHKAISLADDLSGTEMRVAAAITDHFNRKTGQCDPSLDSIAKLLGVSRRTVIRAIGSLVQKGYFDKTRHGGKFHRNSYLPIWSRFRAKETKWKERRTAASSMFESAKLSPLQGQICPLAGDSDVTQTCSSNHLNETSAAPLLEKDTQAKSEGIVRKGLSREASREGSYPIARERFHVKSASSRIAAVDAAERRWTTALTKLYAPTPAVFGVLIDEIDDALRNAATTLEMRKPGSGLHYVLEVLRDHLPTTRTSSVLTALPIASSCDQATREPQT
jgi:DNA-binding MarR family transcriptional regulator